MVPRINGVRDQLGLPPVEARTNFGRPPLLLYLTAEPFEYPRSDWPSNIHMVKKYHATGNQPIVLVTTSSEFQDDGRLVRCALEALADEDVYVVATLPSEN